MKATDHRAFARLGVWASALFITVFGGAYELRAADWPRFGGPDGTWVSSETGLARAWPAEGPRALWTADVGEGFAGPAIRDGEVYLLDRFEDREDILRCLELETGRELWRLAYSAPGKLPYAGSRNGPTVDEQFVFTVGPFGQLHCIDRRTHQSIWAKNLVDDFKDPEVDVATPAESRADKLLRAQVPTWGFTQAPVLYRDTVIVAPQTQKVGVVAYEKSTGRLRWRAGYIGRNWYSHVSPYLTSFAAVDQILMLAQPSDPEKSPAQAPRAIISSVDATTGAILWTNLSPGPFKIPIPEPLRVGPDRLFVTGGFGVGCFMLEVRHPENRWETSVVSPNKTVAGHIHSPVLYQNRIYVLSYKEHGGTSSGLVCLNSAGDRLWQTGPNLQFDSGSFLIADGMALAMHGKTGELYLLELSGTGYRVLAKAKVLSARDGLAWAPMALSQGKLVARDQHQMRCWDIRVGKE